MKLKKIYLWPAALAAIFMSSIIIIISPISQKTIITVPESTNSELVVGIQTTTCCSCPTKVLQSTIGTNGWVLYNPNKDYSGSRPTSCTRVACQPCDQVINYTCPATGWVDCMPGPGTPRPQCQKDFLDWAKTNCPNFQGAAL